MPTPLIYDPTRRGRLPHDAEWHAAASRVYDAECARHAAEHGTGCTSAAIEAAHRNLTAALAELDAIEHRHQAATA